MRYLHNAAGQRVFRSEPTAEHAPPDPGTLGEGFVAWLKQRFASLFSAPQTESTIGTVYVYGDGELPSWALLGEYDNDSALGKGRTWAAWVAHHWNRIWWNLLCHGASLLRQSLFERVDEMKTDVQVPVLWELGAA